MFFLMRAVRGPRGGAEAILRLAPRGAHGRNSHTNDATTQPWDPTHCATLTRYMEMICYQYWLWVEIYNNPFLLSLMAWQAGMLWVGRHWRCMCFVTGDDWRVPTEASIKGPTIAGSRGARAIDTPCQAFPTTAREILTLDSSQRYLLPTIPNLLWNSLCLQYIPRNMHTVLLCFALLWLCNRS